MLILARSLKELRFGELMEIYAGSNRETAARRYGDSDGFALQEVEDDFRQYLWEVFFRTPGAVYALWEEDGRYVSALRLEPYRDGLILSALETSPEERGRGYATQLIQNVQSVIRNLRTNVLYSHVNKRNRISLNIHIRCGFCVISNYATYLDGSVDDRSYTLLYEC